MASVDRAKRVLLVDDCETFVDALRALLESIAGIEIVGVGRSGEQAVALAERLSPDLVIMDLSMPGIGGLQATRILKTLQPAPQVIIVTLHRGSEFRQAALEAGADFFISKDRLHAEFPAVLAEIRR
jgi:two-component system invasion response regulator UvrY